MTRPDRMTGGGLRAATPRRRPRLSVGEQYPARWRRPRYSSAPPAREAHRIPRPALVAERERPMANQTLWLEPLCIRHVAFEAFPLPGFRCREVDSGAACWRP